jgi:catechol 2,3-dioxygenase-like lactoylglutathione lyase family enzyme
MIKLKALNHAAFRVSNVDKATSFYENVIGLKRIPRPDFGFGGAWYGIGNNALHIITVASPIRSARTSPSMSKTSTRPSAR